MSTQHLIDLHTHSTASDGSLTPCALVQYAKRKGLSAIALTDHDTVAGLSEAIDAGVEFGIEVIPGIEITTIVDSCDVHIIGLYIDHKNSVLLDNVEEMTKSRCNRNENIIIQLEKSGVDIHLEDILQYSDRTITKGHIATILIKRGYARNLKEAIDKYMSKGTLGYVRRQTPDPKTCIDIIHDAGGSAFLAHINQIDRANAYHSIEVSKKVISAGIDGIETCYCEYDDFWEHESKCLAKDFKLLCSGGSDFHGSFKENLDLGTGYGNLCVPYSFLEDIKCVRKSKNYLLNTVLTL